MNMKKRLMKSTDNRVLTGTLGGVAEYIGIDPTIARVIFVLAMFIFDGGPILLYILLAVIMPKPKPIRRGYEDRSYDYEPPRSQKNQSRKKAEKFTDDDWSDF